MNNRSLPLRIVAAIWRGLDRLRRFLHLIFLLGFFMILMAAMVGERAFVPRNAALVIAPEGTIVDQLSGDPLERAFARARGLQMQETLLRDLVDAIRAARDDERIEALVLRLDAMTAAGLSKLQELAEELAYFKESGKPVFAVGDGFTRDQYYLAAHADHVFMNPMGAVLVDGYSRYLPYYKTALEKLYIDYNVWTVGEYKSFVEPITRDDMSPEDEEATRVYLQALWDGYQADVTAARDLPRAALQIYADRIAELLAEADGDTAKLALDYGLVDELLTRDAMRQRVREAIGDTSERSDFTGIELEPYVAAVRAETLAGLHPSKVAVIVASGTILDGVQPPGTIGGDSLAELIRRAGDEDDVKALVLRVDSGGGSAFASEVIRAQLEAFQNSGRPVVVSMGSVAASGGYWIAMGADEIWASPSTLTGSIGVGATLPTFQRSLDWLGVHVDGVGTTALAGGFDLTRELPASLRELIGQSVRATYDQFIDKVAEHRNRSPQEIDEVARGRVWVGSDALDRGLVDRLGTLEDAVQSAAERAGLEQGRYSVDYFEQRLGLAEQLVLELAGTAMPLLRALGGAVSLPAAVTSWIEQTMEPLEFVSRWNDPRGIYAYCFCDTR
jgi:protease-4